MTWIVVKEGSTQRDSHLVRDYYEILYEDHLRAGYLKDLVEYPVEIRYIVMSDRIFSYNLGGTTVNFVPKSFDLGIFNL